MRKIVYIITGLLFFIITLSGQNYHKFPDSNFVWNYRIHNYDGSACGTYEYVQLTFGQDTIIASTIYQTLYYTSKEQHYGGAPIWCSGSYYDLNHFCDIIRHDSILKKVFRYDTLSQTEVLLIDFDLTLGQIHPMTAFISDTVYFVNSIDSVLLGDNEFHRRYNFSNIDTLMSCSDTISIEEFSLIEGVGYTRGFNYGANWHSESYMLQAPDCIGLWAEANELYCFGQLNQAWGTCMNACCSNISEPKYRDSIQTSLPSDLCDLTVSIEPNEYSSFKVYPNPSTEIIYIYLHPELLSKSCRIVDINGKTILKTSLTEFNSQIQISSLTPGLYYLIIDGSSFVSKFVKQ